MLRRAGQRVYAAAAATQAASVAWASAASPARVGAAAVTTSPMATTTVSTRALSTAAAAAAAPAPAFTLRTLVGLVAGGAAAAGTSTYMHDDSGLADGLLRSATFWSQAFPIFLHYKLVELRVQGLPAPQQTAAYAPLHDRYAPAVEALTLSLKGFYLKSAQFISILDDFLPAQYMRFCKRTQDMVPSDVTPQQAREIVERELGRPLGEVFASFEETPFSAASVGQVHRATLHDGRQVAVKVMYPGIERMFRHDLTTLKRFCALAQPQHLPALGEIERQFLTEFDYRKEAQNLKAVRRNVLPKWGRRVAIPEPIDGLCTEHVLVMEYLAGQKLVDGVRAHFGRVAARLGTTLEALEEQQKEQIRTGRLRPRSAAAHARWTQAQAALLAVSDATCNAPRWVWNATVGRVLVGRRASYVRSERPLNLGALLQLLMQVHADEVFRDGLFNGDPHPGNILLLDDGRLGLIDYGQIKSLPHATRLSLARLFVALQHDHREEIIRLSTEELSLKTRDMNPDVIYRYTCFYNDRETADITHGLNVQQFSEYLDSTDPVLRINDDVVFVGRCSILLRGLANAFNIRLRTSEFWGPVAQRVLEEERRRPSPRV